MRKPSNNVLNRRQNKIRKMLKKKGYVKKKRPKISKNKKKKIEKKKKKKKRRKKNKNKNIREFKMSSIK